MSNVSQFKRDCSAVTVLAVIAFLYIRELFGYLSLVQHPLLLVLAFSTSWALSCLHDLRTGLNRVAICRAIATTIVFAVSIPLAHLLQSRYAEMAAEIALVPDIAKSLGPDYVALATNRLVGYGGSIAIALLLFRWLAQSRIEKMALHLFIRPEYRASLCPHCSQAMR